MTTTTIEFNASTTTSRDIGNLSRNDNPQKEAGPTQGAQTAASSENALLALLFGN